MDRLQSLGVIGALVLFVFLVASPEALVPERVVAVAVLSLLTAVLFQPEWYRARERLEAVRFVRVVTTLVGAALGGVVGVAVGLPLVVATSTVPYAVTLLLLTISMGAVVGAGFHEEWAVLFGAGSRGLASPHDAYLIDTSALIDGRIAELIERGMLVGNFYVPTFVLVELQQVADSARARPRGRRGLAVVTRLRSGGHIIIKDIDKPELVGADAKLKAIAKDTGVTLITNDGNLKTLCEAEDIAVLSLHELANALRPALFPGDHIEIRLTKSGKRPEQATGFLPDGDMVVVEDGHAAFGRSARVEITRVLPQEGSARRLVFARLERAEPPDA